MLRFNLWILFAVFLFLTGCGKLSGSLTLNSGTTNSTANRIDPDFVQAEMVTTTMGTAGYQIKATIGETVTKQTTSNGWQIDGVFY